MKSKLSLLVPSFLLIFFSAQGFAGGDFITSNGQTLYVSATYNGTLRTFATVFTQTEVTIRNIDPSTSITLNSVDFYAPDGSLEHVFLADPIVLGPLTSTSYQYPPFGPDPPPVYEGRDRPFFLINWEADKAVNAAIVEATAIVLSIPESGGTALEYDYLPLTTRVIRERGNQ